MRRAKVNDSVFTGGWGTLVEALTGGAFDLLNWQHSGKFDQNLSKKSNAQGFARGRGGGWAVLELTGTLHQTVKHS